jgi:iron complex outermembrane receptor protein
MRRTTSLAHVGVALAALWAAAPALAQTTPFDVRGRVLTIEGRVPLPNVTVTIEERRASAVTDDSGEFVFTGQVPGTVHLRTSIEGFAPVRREIVLAPGMAPVTIELKDDMHFTEVVSVSPHPRDPFESYQPTSVLSGQELMIRLEGSLGALLRTEPGVADRSLGPGPSRPVIRGQDGDRRPVEPVS